MKLLLLLLLALPASARSVRVRSHVTKRGTYVQSHRRTSPDKSKSNNWGSRGNVNPDTGKEGTR